MSIKAKASPEQSRVMRAIRKRCRSGATEFTLGGLAGTGKTFVASRLGEFLGMERVIYLAPTGRACLNMIMRLPQDALVSTMHSFLYGAPLHLHCASCPALRQLDDEACHGTSRGCGCDLDWTLKHIDTDVDMFVIDEASMVGEGLYDDLCAAVPDAFKVFIGDHGQLPPPYNSRFNLMDDPDLRLEAPHRTTADSPILKLSRMARDGRRLPMGVLGDGVTRDYPTGLPIGWDPEDNDALVLTRTKITRLRYNRKLRARLGMPRDVPAPGDMLICRDNNWDKGVVNGTRARLLSVKDSARHCDAYMLEADLFETGGVYEGYAPKEQFNKADQISRRWGMERWEYGYALHVHIAQGSEAKRVVLIEEHPYFKDADWPRWLYTGITRASEQLTILVLPYGYSH